MSYLIKLNRTDSQGVVRIVKFKKTFIILNFLIILTLLIQYVSPVIAETLNQTDAETEEIQDDESEDLNESEEADIESKENEQISNEIQEPEPEQELEPEQEQEQEPDQEQEQEQEQEPVQEQEPGQEQEPDQEQEPGQDPEQENEPELEQEPEEIEEALETEEEPELLENGEDAVEKERSFQRFSVQDQVSVQATSQAVFTSATLNVERDLTSSPNRVSLIYAASSLLTLTADRNLTIIFDVPSELMNRIQSKDGVHQINRLLGLPLPGGRKVYTDAEVKLDNVNSQIYLNLSLPNLDLGLTPTFSFRINLYYDSLPLRSDGTYNFQAAAINGTEVVGMDSITGTRPTASFSVTNPVVPPLTFATPMFSTDGTIRGTGVPGYTARITVGGQTFTSVVASNGTFAVNIGARTAGTIIRGVQVRENVLLSSEITTTVIQRPNPPNLLEIYDQDTVVRGTAPPNTTVRLTIGTKTYSGPAGNDGSFAINIQSARVEGTQISAVTINAQQHTSLPGGTVVLGSGLSLVSVPETMPFGTHSLENVDSLMPLADSNWAIRVQDTRATGSRWRLDATLAHPLRARTMRNELPEALVFVDQNNQMTPLSSSALTVFSGTTTSKEPVNISWTTNRGPMLQIVPEAMADTYSTTITWTLSDVP